MRGFYRRGYRVVPAMVAVLAAVGGGLAAARAPAATRTVSSYVLSAADNELREGSYNTGFWDKLGYNSAGNDNYFTGSQARPRLGASTFFPSQARGFLMFDLTRIRSPKLCKVATARRVG